MKGKELLKQCELLRAQIREKGKSKAIIREMEKIKLQCRLALSLPNRNIEDCYAKRKEWTYYAAAERKAEEILSKSA